MDEVSRSPNYTAADRCRKMNRNLLINININMTCIISNTWKSFLKNNIMFEYYLNKRRNEDEILKEIYVAAIILCMNKSQKNI